MTANPFKAALAQRRRQIGLWSMLGSSIGAEILAHCGFDWIVVDMEHAPNDLRDVLAQLQAMKGGTAAPVVRPPWNDFVTIKRLLDAGARDIIIPYVQTREEAEMAVKAVRYPPRGIRGVAGGSRASNFGRVKDYLANADGQITLIVQVETAEAMARLDEIASVEGVDGVFIGPADLAASMGHIGNPNAPQVQEAIKGAAERLAAMGKASGILTGVEADARRYIEWGFTFVAVGIDTAMLVKAGEGLVGRFAG